MKIGIGLIAWDRPHYFKKTIASLEANNLSGLDFHLFQDGDICKFTGNRVAEEKHIKENINIFRVSNLPNKQLHWRDLNVCIAINHYEAMTYLSHLYDYFIIIEEDVIFSPNYFVLIKKALKQFEGDKKISSVSPSFRLSCKPKEIPNNLDKLIPDGGHMWAEAFWSKKWREIEKHYIQFYNIVKDTPYRKRNSAKIFELFKKTKTPMSTSSRDNGMDWAIKIAGMQRVRFVVNRATGIGDYGFHGTPEKLRKFGDGHNKIYHPDEELKIEKFEIIKK